jgi:predicted RNA-binding protein with PUA-like domain
MPYLLKTEPSAYSFDDLDRDGETVWDGIRNPQALNTLASMKKGDDLAIYHSVTDKQVVGQAKVVAVDASDPKNPRVTIKAHGRLRRPKTLAEMRDEPSFAGSLLFRQFRLSVVPLTDEQFRWLVHG